MAGVVVLGGGVTGGAFVAALRRLDEDVPITLVERELVGGECSYWACIPSKTMLRPLEVAQRARVTPGAAEGLASPIDPAPIFAWRVEPEAGELLADAFREEGVDVRLGARAQRVEVGNGSLVSLHLEGGEAVEGQELLVATGRRPNVEGFGLERLDLRISRGGIDVD